MDPPAPQSIRVVNMTFISQNAPNIKKKLKGGTGINLSQLVDIAFKVYKDRESKKTQEVITFLEQFSG